MIRTQERYLFDPEVNAGKMIFLSGPRQVGKTTFVRRKLEEMGYSGLYFNWDDPLVRREYMRNPHFLKPHLAGVAKGPSLPLVAFDEIHKHRNWKNILKGLCDLHAGEAQLIVTGSARLDLFRRSGDSLVGRYFLYRLLPIGPAEAAEKTDVALDDDNVLARPDAHDLLRRVQEIDATTFQPACERLLRFGGFPEPFLRARERFSVKWRRDYLSLLIREDLRDLSRIRDIQGVEQLTLLLPERIGSPISVNALRNDLEVNHRTVRDWLDALEKIYLVFSVMPWSARIARAIRKERKYYFWDWTMAAGEGAVFENFVAVLLLRLVARWNELGLGDFDLRYVRNHQGREVDFLLVKNRRPIALFEAKTSDTNLAKDGVYFGDALRVPYYQIVRHGDVVESRPGLRYILPAARFLPLLG